MHSSVTIDSLVDCWCRLILVFVNMMNAFLLPKHLLLLFGTLADLTSTKVLMSGGWRTIPWLEYNQDLLPVLDLWRSGDVSQSTGADLVEIVCTFTHWM